MGLLDAILSGGSSGGGLLDFLKNNAMNQQFNSGLQSDQAQYAQPAPQQQAMAQMLPPQQQPITAPPPMQGQPAPQQMAPQNAPQPQMPGIGDLLGRIGHPNGLIPRLRGTDDRSVALQQQQQFQNSTFKALVAKGVDEQTAMTAVIPGNTKMLEELVKQTFGPKSITSIGEGYVTDKDGKIIRAYKPEDKTPTSVSEYEYYTKNFQPTPQQQSPMPYDVWSTAKSRAGATNISNNIDMNSGQTYDKQLAEGLGKAHATLANGVEDAQARARDVAAMQGAVDAIQKNGGTTGGLGQQQILDLKKTINAGSNALGIDKPFNESDLADKEFLTKFNRSMAGAQAKGAVGARVTNFEMSNFLKANPGLDMSVTGNQRLLGIQGQIEERNIAVGNAIRDATASAISEGKKINPVTVQHIIKSYDDEHHIKDVVTGQDLTQSYALPEFQNTPSNASMAKAHEENLKTIERTIGGVTYEQRNGQWYPK